MTDDTTETVEVSPIVGDPAEIVELLQDYAAAHDQNEED